MSAGPPLRWSLDAPAFERLLGTLSPDRDRAAVEYTRLHDRVVGLLRWWGSSRATELADETLDRLARKLAQGTEIQPGSLGAYARAVARRVFYESREEPPSAPLPAEVLLAPSTDDERESAMRCFDGCLESFAPDDRTQLLRYYDHGGGKIDARRRLGAELRLSPGALRIRMHRLRERLGACVTACLSATLETFRG
ncbi:MAG: hypothetical protein ACRD2J_14410 [Thermoanaerobaculia bacterium]